MTFPAHADLDRLAAAVEALRALEAGAGAGVGAGANSGRTDPVSPAGPALNGAREMVRSLAVLGAVRAAVDAVALQRIAVLERERSLDPESDPVRAAGHPNVESLLAELWKTSLPAARQLCGVARATAPRHTLHGEVLPAEFPDLAEAMLGDQDSVQALTALTALTRSEVPATGPATLPVICGRGCRSSRRA